MHDRERANPLESPHMQVLGYSLALASGIAWVFLAIVAGNFCRPHFNIIASLTQWPIALEGLALPTIIGLVMVSAIIVGILSLLRPRVWTPIGIVVLIMIPVVLYAALALIAITHPPNPNQACL